MLDALRNAVLSVADSADLPPAERLALVRALVSDGQSTSGFGGATMAWFGGSGDALSAEEAPPEETPSLPVPPHLEVLEPIGVGGMGEVWRVRDRETGAQRALKTIRAAVAHNAAHVALFERELFTTDNLQHPGIPPVTDHGVLEDGRRYYAMKIYEGRTFYTALREARGGPRTFAALRPLVEHLVHACEAVGFAHGRGVIHRDLKPANLYLGEFGEVIVLDWGIAGFLPRLPEGGYGVLAGERAGTPGYLAPEQAPGRWMGPPVDVWAFGVMLGEVLDAGTPSADGDPPEVRELAGIAVTARHADPKLRPADANVLATRLREWLDLGDRRARALQLVAQADEEGRLAERLTHRAAAARARALALGEGLQPWHPAEARRAVWRAEDEAEDLTRQADLHLLERERLLNATFTHAPQLREAHARLAAIYRARHEAAESARDVAGSGRWELLLRVHDRGENAAYLNGEGAVTLVTEPAGVRARLHRYVLRDRRLVPEFVADLGETPIVEARVPHGSWVVELALPGHQTVWHPVNVSRLEHVDGVPPGASEPRPIPLPVLGSLDPDDVLVTPGWTYVGWDREAANAPPDGRVWVDGFVARRFPTTNREYLAFLNALLLEGREDEALRWAPREKGSAVTPKGRLLYGFGPEGFYLTRDAEGTLWEPDWPVFMVDFDGAEAYASWRRARDGSAWALPDELQWERAARGADKRHFPWGDHWEATWAHTRSSFPPDQPLMPRTPEACAGDVSPFGVQALAGCVREWCQNSWGTDNAPPELAFPAVRGGGWTTGPVLARIGTRTFTGRMDRGPQLGFRLVRPL